MRFAYKINSSYDGFAPRKIPERLQNGTLRLGWALYIDSVEVGDEIWVYFLGPHRFVDGVYIKGVAEVVDYGLRAVWVRPAEVSTTQPLGDPSEGALVAQIVDTRFRQVFLLPEHIGSVPHCDLPTIADTCRNHLCSHCSRWRSLPGVRRAILQTPHRLDGSVEKFAPAFWVIPRRSFLYSEGRIRAGILQTSELFYRFKAGDDAMAYPLALGMHRALSQARRTSFDAIIPVPLSPDKQQLRELDRTGALADELSEILGVPVRRWLSLSDAISKRGLRTTMGFTAREFETEYAGRLLVDQEAGQGGRLLLVDDVCTEGSTLRVCAEALAWANDTSAIVAATAGQMVVRRAVSDASSLLE